MKFKKSLLIIGLIICLFAMASASASDVNDTMVGSEDTCQMELSAGSELDVDNLKTSEENTTLTQTNDDEIVGGEIDSEVIGDDIGTYSGLSEEIRSGGNIELQHNYYTYDSGFTIAITVNNSVIDGKGAVIDMNGSTIMAFLVSASGVTIKNLTIKNANYDGLGGAIYFSNSATSGTVSNCNFTDNSARDGGAIFFVNTGNVTNCNFVNNTAPEWGGAIRFKGTGTVTNCNFTDNKAGGDGGAIRMYSGSVENCNFTDNKAGREGGAIHFSSSGTVTNCNFTDNEAYDGGAVYFLNTGNVSNCNFADNSASRGGAIFSNNLYTAADTCIFKRNSGDNFNVVIYPPTLNVDNFTTFYGSGEKLTFNLTTDSGMPVNNGNISISVYFKDNSSWVGNYSCLSGEGWTVDLPVGFYYAIFNTEYAGFQQINRTITITPEHTFWALNQKINGNDKAEINLTNDYYYDSTYDSAFIGGIDINRPVTINGNGHTIDAKGQARILYVQADNVNITNITFVNGKAYDGGAIYWYGANGAVSGSCFTENNAEYGGAIYWHGANGAVSGSCFTGNNATEDGDAIFGLDVEADYCWFGGNATNYMDALPINPGVKWAYILFLNATANPNTVQAFNTSEIIFKLYCYNNIERISEYDNTLLLPVNLTITSVNGTVDSPVANLGNPIKYTATGVGDASVTATFATAEFTIKLNNLIADPNLSVENQVVTFGENTTIALNYVPNATGKVNITLTGKKGTLTYQDIDLNATIMLPNDIPADEYNVTVSYSGDVNFFNASTNATLTVNKANSTLIINDNVTFDYNTNGSTTVSFTNASSVVAEVIGHPDAIVDVNCTTITVSGLDAGNYTLSVTTITDENHNNVTKTANITVNKVKTEFAADAITATYNINKDLVITLKDGNGNPVSGVSVSVDLNGAKNYTTDENGTVIVSTLGLAAGNYVANITFAGNENYIGSNATANVTINKDTTKITANAVTTTYQVNKNLVITLKDSQGKALSGAKVTVNLNGAKTYTTDKNGQIKINVAKLVPKKYTAKVTFAGNTNYLKSTADVKVTVKKAKAKIKAKKKTYKANKKNKKFKITLKDNKGKPIKKAKVRLIVKKIKKTSKKKTSTKTKKNKKKNIKKTNKKGKITFKINRNKKGKYMATVKFYGNEYYAKTVKKVKIKMK